MKKTLIGLGLLALAGYLLFGGSFDLPDLGISFWHLLFIVGFGFATLRYLWRKEWTNSYVCGAITFILLNNHFDWLKVGNGVIIFAIILAGIGLQLLFGKKGIVTINGKSIHEYRGEKKKSLNVSDTVFGSTTRYINDDNFLDLGGDVVFATDNIFFDNAVILGDKATYSGDAVFSTVKLYVPKTWAVEFTGDRVFSSIQVRPSGATTDKTLVVTGDFVFSRLEVSYI